MSLRPRRSLPLWLHCIVEGIFQGLTRGLRHKFLPHLFQFVQDAATMEPMAVSTGKRPRQHWDGRTRFSAATEENAWREYFFFFVFFFYTNKPQQDPCSMWSFYKFKVFHMSKLFENQGCGNIVLVKYQLMACESAILFMLMISFCFFFFFTPAVLRCAISLFTLSWKLSLLLPSHSDSCGYFLFNLPHEPTYLKHMQLLSPLQANKTWI